MGEFARQNEAPKLSRFWIRICSGYMKRRFALLPGEICRRAGKKKQTGNLTREGQLSRQKSAEAVVPKKKKKPGRAEQ